MTTYLDMESAEQAARLSSSYEVIIVGGGAAGLTIARELAEHGIKICVIESGSISETAEHEALNAVEVHGSLQDPQVQARRQEQHGPQLRFWSAKEQRYGARIRVFGGSTTAWAGKVAPFDELDFSARHWIPDSGWPISRAELVPFFQRAAEHLDLGPLVSDNKFWQATGRAIPEPVSRMKYFDSFFWQVARSRHAMTEVMRFGPDFQRENFKSVTVLLNATVASLVLADGRTSGVSLISSLRGTRKVRIDAPFVVLAAGAIENARLLLLSGLAEPDATAPTGRPAIGRYLIDHPAVTLGEFDEKNREKASRLLGFFPLQRNYRVYMYSHGLSLRPAAQQEFGLPNMAVFAATTLSKDDPLLALRRLATRKSDRPLRDIGAVVQNFGLVVTSVGRKVLENARIPVRIRRGITDATVLLNANFVARDYLASGRSRKLESLALALIVEQPPQPDNCIRLSNSRDRLGLPKAEIRWDIGDDLRAAMLEAGELLVADLERAGVTGFHPAPAFATKSASDLVLTDFAHTAGTTRMGVDSETSVVDDQCQVHGVTGLYVAGASVFPTVGHANPTLVILAMAIRLADRLLLDIRTQGTKVAVAATPRIIGDASRPLVLVTGATGALGHHVVDELCNKGCRVRAQYRKRAPDDHRVEWVHLDFSDPGLAAEELDRSLSGVDAVIHLAASLSQYPEEMETTNIVNLERLADACARVGVRYFGQASSMVVYGSPRVGLVTEETPLIDPSRPLEKQYLADHLMRGYARSKRIGEDILRRYADRMHIDLCRIAVAYPVFEEALHWGPTRRIYSLYRNSHFISPRTVARAFVHLMERSLGADAKGVEAYNICDRDSPTFAEVYKRAGRASPVYIPLVLDYLKGVKTAKGLTLRRPHGAFRMDNRKLKETGFQDV